MKNEKSEKNMKMKINKDRNSVCNFCNEKWPNVPEMYDMMFLESDLYTICKSCMNQLSMKFLKADCLYNGKLKSNEDLARVRRYEERCGHSIHAMGYKVK